MKKPRHGGSLELEITDTVVSNSIQLNNYYFLRAEAQK